MITESQKKYILEKCLIFINATFQDNMKISDEDWIEIADSMQEIFLKTKENRICSKALGMTAGYINDLQQLFEKGAR